MFISFSLISKNMYYSNVNCGPSNASESFYEMIIEFHCNYWQKEWRILRLLRGIRYIEAKPTIRVKTRCMHLVCVKFETDDRFSRTRALKQCIQPHNTIGSATIHFKRFASNHQPTISTRLANINSFFNKETFLACQLHGTRVLLKIKGKV